MTHSINRHKQWVVIHRDLCDPCLGTMQHLTLQLHFITSFRLGFSTLTNTWWLAWLDQKSVLSSTAFQSCWKRIHFIYMKYSEPAPQRDDVCHSPRGNIGHVSHIICVPPICYAQKWYCDERVNCLMNFKVTILPIYETVILHLWFLYSGSSERENLKGDSRVKWQSSRPLQ